MTGVVLLPRTRPPATAGEAPRAASTFDALGTRCRVIVESRAGGPDPGEAVVAVRRLLDEAERRLSRFRPDSDLSRLNAEPDEVVPVVPLVADALASAVDAAVRTGGLLDPTVLPALVAGGYAESRRGVPPVGLLAALRDAPPRRPAGPAAERRWADVRVSRRDGTVRRPPGVRLDVGATAKGWLADRCAALLHPFDRWAVDLGGDLRVGGPQALARPFAVAVAGPLGGTPVGRLWLGQGAVATSGVDRRLWRRPDGTPAHHLIDPATGEPAWTGLLTATAVAPTAEEAEAVAGATLLRGPAGVDRLALRGGLAVDDDGRVHRRPTDRRGAWRWSA